MNSKHGKAPRSRWTNRLIFPAAQCPFFLSVGKGFPFKVNQPKKRMPFFPWKASEYKSTFGTWEVPSEGRAPTFRIELQARRSFRKRLLPRQGLRFQPVLFLLAWDGYVTQLKGSFPQARFKVPLCLGAPFFCCSPSELVFLTLPSFFQPSNPAWEPSAETCFSNPEKSFLFNPSPCFFTLCLEFFTLGLAFFTRELACFTPQPCFSHPKPKTT